MTVTYTAEVATCRGFGCFLALLLRWRGSIYKLVWPDLFCFLTLYYSLNLSYRYVLTEEQKRTFEQVSEYCDSYSNYIPLSFVLGFYISIIMTRWWDQYSTIPWPDPVAVYVSAHIHGQDERGRLMRRTIMRYVCLCLTMVFSMICPRVKKRFPTLEHLVDAGLMTENEKCIVVDLNDKFPRHSKHWLPIVWAASIVTRARKEGRIRDDFAVKTIIDELNVFRGKCGMLLNYDTISVPLVYTQVVTLATYSFVITSAIGRQWWDDETTGSNSTNRSAHANPIDKWFPVFTTLQFFFYMGWLKVAESLINPFGEDDDDFEINWIVDRNISVAYLIVDEMHHEHPELIKDQYWDQVFPTELPHTVESQPFKEKIPQPSTANIAVNNMNEYISPSSVKIDDMGRMNDDNQSGIHFMAGRSMSRQSMSGRNRTTSAGSQASLTAWGSSQVGPPPSGSLPRVASVTSVLKRIFSRTDTSTPATVDGPPPVRMPESQSTTSLSAKAASANVGSTRTQLTDQVIQEVDEQTTITSTAGRPIESRPTAMSIFAHQMASSNPIPVPGSAGATSTSHGDRQAAGSLPPTMPVSPARSPYPEMSVHSAPGFENSSGLGSGSIGPQGDTVSIGSSTTTTDEGDDEFERLKEARRREMERIMLARSISVIAGSRVPSPDNEDIALLDMTVDSQTTLLQNDK
ncbi:Bestrophin, RFP-TM, chloride channel [Nesidiocoris tenuis]|uniref:Bestrophin homolog n=1 Tax=Nesidiocoris tenuis TaxID=355587 RepID=A0ABN7B4X9_9HEMI|nr:Bestrophin, RFP-TM, chloride channel [Nesidiocoris tenuis]